MMLPEGDYEVHQAVIGRMLMPYDVSIYHSVQQNLGLIILTEKFDLHILQPLKRFNFG